VFVIIKYIEKEKNYMLTLELETMCFVSKEYCHHTLTCSATSSCSKPPPFRNIHLWKQS